MDKKITDFLEGLVILVIILVLIQTFLEDLSVLLAWTWSARRVLVITGFFFDLFFTVEFLIRIYAALSRGALKKYLGQGLGWIDFLASVPLLILSSGPGMVMVLSGSGIIFSAGGVLNILKIVKTVRIARILRLLRVLKIFKQIKNVNSIMAQRHLMKITATSVSTLVLTLFFFNLFAGSVGMPQAGIILEDQYQGTMAGYLSLSQKAGTPDAVAAAARQQPDLLIIKEGDTTHFSRYDNEYFRLNFGPGEYEYREEGGIGFFFDLRRVQALESRNNLMYFVLILILTAVLLLFYSPHFALTVSDPIHVMNRGMEEKDYNFEVKIDPRYSEDGVFRLARNYNQIFLPMKDLNNRDAETTADDLQLKMDDIKDLFS
jgi:hypothetical protein